MARGHGNSFTGTITGALDRVITDYPLLVLHATFILGVLLGQQTAKSRFSLPRWVESALPEPRALAASLPSFTRRSSTRGRKSGRRPARRRTTARVTRSKGQSKMTVAAS